MEAKLEIDEFQTVRGTDHNDPGAFGNRAGSRQFYEDCQSHSGLRIVEEPETVDLSRSVCQLRFRRLLHDTVGLLQGFDGFQDTHRIPDLNRSR